MDVLIVLVFVSLVLVAGAVLLLLVSLNQRDFEHAERLSLLPFCESSSSARPGDPVPHATARESRASELETQRLQVPELP